MSIHSSKQSIILKKTNGKTTLWHTNVLFFDVRRKNNNMTFQELLYADDTLVIAKNTQTAKDYLRYIEEESEYTT